MCGDGANDGPALRQAQIGIAVLSATDVAKAAAGAVLTEPGLSGIVFAVREGRIAFQRLLTYALNMLIKKIEIVLLLAIGLTLTGHAVMTPVLMVLHAADERLPVHVAHGRPGRVPRPGRAHGTCEASPPPAWRSGCASSASPRRCWRSDDSSSGSVSRRCRRWTFVTLVFGNQALLYVLRERRRMWRSKPSAWVFASSVADIAIVVILAVSGTLMVPLPWRLVVAACGAAAAFAVLLDQVKVPILSVFKIERQTVAEPSTERDRHLDCTPVPGQDGRSD